MRLMHTKLPEFYEKLHRAGEENGGKAVTIRGLENLHSAKLQSLRVGRIEEGVKELAQQPDIQAVEVAVIPRVPETMHTVVIKGLNGDHKPEKIILEVVNILHSTEEAEFDGCTDIQDRRPPIGLH